MSAKLLDNLSAICYATRKQRKGETLTQPLFAKLPYKDKQEGFLAIVEATVRRLTIAMALNPSVANKLLHDIVERDDERIACLLADAQDILQEMRKEPPDAPQSTSEPTKP